MNALVAIVAATQWEVKPWLKATDSKPAGTLAGGAEVFRGSLKEIPVVTAIGGIGMTSARQATQNVLATYKPTAILSVGFAGSLLQELKAGDFVIEGRAGGLDLVALGAGNTGAKIRIGRIASAKEVLETPQKKTAFRETTGADAVDMEWEGVKAAAQEAGVLCAAVKIISDAMEEKIPLPKGLRRHEGPLSGTRVFREMLKDPLSMPKTIWFGTRSAKLSKDLAGFLQEFIVLAAPIAGKIGGHPQETRQAKTCL